MGLDRFSCEDDCALFITTKNNVGDPVIRTVQSICETYPTVTAIFLNCDLRDRVTSGRYVIRYYDIIGYCSFEMFIYVYILYYVIVLLSIYLPIYISIYCYLAICLSILIFI